MACNALTNGYSIPCKVPGGTKRFIINTYSGATSFNSDTNDIITGATLTTQFYNFQQRLETADLKSEVTTSIDGAPKYTHTATLNLNNYDYTNRKLLKALVDNDLNIIVESNSGVFYLLERAYVKSAPITIGKAINDMVGATVTFEAINAEPMKTVSAAYVASLTIL